MANKKKLKADKKNKSNSILPPPEPWISMRSGTIIIVFTSVGMAILTALQVAPIKGWLEAAFWGILFGGLIWLIFFGMIYINRFFKR